MIQVHVLGPGRIDKATNASLPGENRIIVEVDDEMVAEANLEFLVVAIVLLSGHSFLEIEVINVVGPFLA